MANKNYRIGILLSLQDKMSQHLAKIDGQAKKLESTSKRLNRTNINPMVKLNDRISAPLRTIESKLKSLGRMTLVVGGTGVLAAGGGVKYGLKLAGEMEQANIAFETMLGSAEKAKIFLEDLTRFAVATPFEMPQLQDASRKLLAFGFESQRVIPMLTAVGNAASGLGLGDEGMQRIILALGQMKAKAKISGEEMLQLTEAGVPAWDILAKAMGKSTAEVMKLSQKGLIPADQAIDALVKGMNEKFPDMMMKQSKSLFGLISTLKDFGNLKFFWAFGEGIRQTAVPALQRFVDMLDKNEDGTKRVQERLMELGRTVGTFVVDKFEGLYKWFEKLSSNETFQRMSFGDKFIFVINQGLDSLSSWLDGPGSEKVSVTFTKLAGVAVQSWWTGLKGLTSGGIKSLFKGDFDAAAGQLLFANLISGGLLALGGGAILKKGGGAVVKKIAGRRAAKMAGEEVTKRGARSAAKTAGKNAAEKGIHSTSRPMFKDSDSMLKRWYKVSGEKMPAVKSTNVKKIGQIPESKKSIDLFSILSKNRVGYKSDEKRYLKVVGEKLRETKPMTKEQMLKRYQTVGGDRLVSRTKDAEDLLARINKVSAEATPTAKVPLWKKLIPERGSNRFKAYRQSNLLARYGALQTGGGRLAGAIQTGTKWLGRLAPVAAIGTEAYEIYKAKDKKKAAVAGASGLAGMWGGAAGGAKLGAAIGTFIAPGLGTAIGGAIGGIAGGAVGYFGGKKLAGTIYDSATANKKSADTSKDSAKKVTSASDKVVSSQDHARKSIDNLGTAADNASVKLGNMGGKTLPAPTTAGFKQLDYQKHALGGILTRPHLGMVAEAGPEAIIPLSNRMRNRSLALWQETGQRLGVVPYADGGFAGLVDNTRTASARPGRGDLNLTVSVSGIDVQVINDIDEDAMALTIGRKVLQGIKQAIENQAS